VPVVNGLEERFGAQVDFFHLNIDQSVTRDVRDRYGIRNRSEYVLLDAEGNIVKKWFGSLSFIMVSDFLEEYLGTLEESPG
jgi:hypothetical protein